MPHADDVLRHSPPRDDTPHPAEERSNVPVPRRTYGTPAPLQPSAGVVAQKGETSSSAIAAREKALVEAPYLVAIGRPRNFDAALLRIQDACRRPDFAAVARYSKPVGTQKVHGLSIRFAELARVLWGNINVTAFLVWDDDVQRVYRVSATDLETNASDAVDVVIEKFVERSKVPNGAEQIGEPRVGSRGQLVYKIRATEDDLTVKVNANISKAKRNVILALIPADVKDDAEAIIVETQKNEDARDPAEARKRLLGAFWTLGVTPEQIDSLLGKPIVQINPAELTMLRAYYTALKDGESTWAEIAEAHGAATAQPVTAAPKGAGSKLKTALKVDARDASHLDDDLEAEERELVQREAKGEASLFSNG